MATHRIVWHDSRENALAEETQAIKLERPAHNVVGTPKASRRMVARRLADKPMDLDVLAGHRVVGAAEIARVLNVSRQRVQQLVTRSEWPEPYDELAMGKVWRIEDVEAWIQVHRLDLEPEGA